MERFSLAVTSGLPHAFECRYTVLDEKAEGEMRTTVEMNDKLRAELLRLSAEKGEKGFSNIVQEAVAAYIVASGKTKVLQQKARKLKGALKGSDEKALKKEMLKIRNSWR